jgi:hypothetical protein
MEDVSACVRTQYCEFFGMTKENDKACQEGRYRLKGIVYFQTRCNFSIVNTESEPTWSAR